jgi:AcrR family transcriptional regulator
MEAVAASAGVSKGTLYARYPTKEALLRAVVEEQLAAWRANETRRLGPLPDGFRPRMVVQARAIIEALGSEKMRAFETLVGGAGSHGGELARALHETGYRMAIEGLTEEIVEGTRADPVPPRDPARVAEMLMALLYGWYSANESVRGVSAVEARDFADEAVAMLFAARAAW